MSFLNPVFKLFGQFLMILYKFTGSYVLALIIFTILIKLILFPVSFKSKKSTMRTQALQGQLQQLQKQYGKDKDRYNQEVTKLYEEAGVNPMGGCLWSLIPLPILWGVYAIVRRPLFFVYNLTSDQVDAVQAAVEGIVGEISGNTSYIEIQIANLLDTNSACLEAAKAALGDASTKLSTTINFTFLGINLSETPKLNFWSDGISWGSVGLFLMPVLLAFVAFLSSLLSMKTNNLNTNSSDNASANATSKQMMIIMPIMYIWFGFIMPAGMCIYMMISILLQMVQEVVSSRILRSKFMEEQNKKEELERKQKAEERRKKQEKIEQRQREEEEAKKRRKKNSYVSKKKSDTGPKTNKGAIGIRRYALGRNYEPDRYGGVTPYRDPTDIVDEAALEAALARKKQQQEKNNKKEEKTEDSVQDQKNNALEDKSKEQTSESSKDIPDSETKSEQSKQSEQDAEINADNSEKTAENEDSNTSDSGKDAS